VDLYKNNIHHPKNGVAMGSPISGTIAEIMLQHIENQHVKHLIEAGNITYYTRNQVVAHKQQLRIPLMKG